MTNRTGTPLNRKNGADAEYAKGLNESAKIGEVVQIAERGIAPVRAGVKLAIVVSVLALIASFVAGAFAIVAVS